MSQWRDLMAQAETAKRVMLRDRSAGEQEFGRLLAVHPRDGMLYFKRGEAFEAMGESELAAADYSKAEVFFPMPAWKARAHEATERTTGCG